VRWRTSCRKRALTDPETKRWIISTNAFSHLSPHSFSNQGGNFEPGELIGKLQQIVRQLLSSLPTSYPGPIGCRGTRPCDSGAFGAATNRRVHNPFTKKLAAWSRAFAARSRRARQCRGDAHGNAQRSRVPSAIEHVFAPQKGPVRLTIRTIGIARARMFQVLVARPIARMRGLPSWCALPRLWS
jgi:hypothetical protein